MKVYVVFEDDYDGSWIRGIFTTLHLARRYVIKDQHKEWQTAVERTGQAVPGTQRWTWWFNGTTGESGHTLESQEHYAHPGPFWKWALQKPNRSELRIADEDLIAT